MASQSSISRSLHFNEIQHLNLERKYFSFNYKVLGLSIQTESRFSGYTLC